DSRLAVSFGTPTFNISGTFRKSAGTGTTTVFWAFNNTGTGLAQAQSGTLSFGDSSTGISLTNTGILEANGGSIVIPNATTLTNSSEELRVRNGSGSRQS